MEVLNFIIYSPPFDPHSGGILVLHELYKQLKKRGHNATLFSMPLKEFNVFEKKVNDLKLIAIYPEVVLGNPLKANHVVRWVLNSPGEIKRDTTSTWLDSDLVYKFIKAFTTPPKLKVKGELRCWVNEFSKFKSEEGVRQGCVYITRKSRKIPLDSHPSDCVLVDKFLTDLDKLIDILSTSNLFISYDMYTYYSLIAALCGCDSIVIPHEGVNKEIWKSEAPSLKYGVGYGFSDLEWASQTKHLVKQHLQNLEEESMHLIDSFIIDCKNLISQK